MLIKSLMSFPITIILPSGDELVIAPSGAVAVVKEATPAEVEAGEERTLHLQGALVPVRAPRPRADGATTPKTVVTATGGVEAPFPEPEEGVVLLVNAVVLEALRASGRTDVYAPDTGESARRDDAKRVTGVYGLIPIGA